MMNRARAAAFTFLFLRVVAGLFFLQHGGVKLFGWLGGLPPGGATAHFPSQMWVGGVLEFVGGSLILLGLFTQPVAFLLSGEMAVAYWQFHAPNGFWPITNHGELAVLYCFVYLFMASVGGGEWSLDALIRRKLKAARNDGDSDSTSCHS